jgi:hypothetical protein
MIPLFSLRLGKPLFKNGLFKKLPRAISGVFEA